MSDNLPPPLPSESEVSNDGRELWSWAGDMGRYIQKQARISELSKEIRECGTKCGDCYLWMKSRECPMERPGEGKRSGYSVGPSMNHPICGKYVESASTTSRRINLNKELQSITS